MTIARASRSTTAGFTLVELLICLTIIGIVAGGLVWRSSRSSENLQTLTAITKARSLDQAKLDYLQKEGDAAQTAWTAATDDAARYLLIREHLYDPTSESTLAAFAPKDYSYVFDASSITIPTKTMHGAAPVDTASIGKFTLTLSSNNIAAGQVMGGGMYDSGTTVTITASPYAGYQFINWTRAGVTLSTSSSVDVVVSATDAIVANFAAAPASTRTLTVNRNIPSAGVVLPAGGSYSSGAVVSLTATPNTGYQFDSWSGDIGAANPASATLSVTMGQDRLVQANFLRPRVQVTVQTNNSFWGSVSGGGSVPVGTNIVIAATPMLGYQFDHWADAVGTISTSSSYTYTVTGTKTLTAVFVANIVSGVTSGTYGDANNIPQITVDAQGRVTGASNIPFSGSLADSGVAAGSYGSASSIPTFTVTSKGVLSLAGNVAIAIPETAVSGLTGKYLPLAGGTMSGTLGMAASQINFSFQGSTPGGGPGIRWTDGTYGNTLGLYVNAGLNYQGNASNPDFKVRVPTTDGSLGAEVIHLGGASTAATSWFNGGPVGIGTTTPSEKLDVVGGIRSSGSTAGTSRIVLQSTAAGGQQYEWYNDYTGAGGGVLALFNRTAGNNPINFAASGYVGIGPTAPGARIDVGTTTADKVRSYGGFVGNPAANIDGTGGSAYLPSGLYVPSGNSWLYGSVIFNGVLQDNSGGSRWSINSTNGNALFTDRLYINSTSHATGGFYYGGATNGLIIGNYGSSPWPGTNGIYVGGTYQGRINRGSYGSISVGGSTNGWAGIDFTAYTKTFMVNSTMQGIYDEGGAGWLWRFDNGSLAIGTVPWTSVSGKPSLPSGNWYWSGQGGQPSWLWGSNDGTNMYVWNPSNFSVARAQRATNNFYIDDNYGLSVVGAYNSYRYQGVYAMGDAYKLPADGSTPGNLYGLAWTHDNVGGQSKAGLSHQLLIMHNGTTQTAIGYGIWTAGNVTVGGATSSTSFNATSTRRFKDNIVGLQSGSLLQKAIALRPVEYDWKKGKGKGGHDIGFIAEEVGEIMPEVIGHDEKGEVSGLDYSRLTVAAIGAIKELNNQNAALEARLRKVESAKFGGAQFYACLTLSAAIGLVAGVILRNRQNA